MAQADPSVKPDNPLHRPMQSEINLFIIIAVVAIVVAIALPTADGLVKLLEDKAYHIDEIIVAFLALSFVVLVFLVRGWRRVQFAIEQMETRSAIDGRLSQMTGLLHACFSVDEASPIISHFARQLFPDQSGALYVYRSSRNLLEETTLWGEPEGHESMFGPQQCWALRQGQRYTVLDPQNSILCGHVHHDHPYTCLPMMAHGEVLALLHISPKPGSAVGRPLFDRDQDLLRIFTERVALALSNLKLRESLRQQSIRDPLTGLFNRRYLEEALLIEMERAKRGNTPFSIIMLDLDHFKRFNDTYGHEAGDVVLKDLGTYLQHHVRGGDIACRYGGEEFTLLLPNTSLEVVQQRAQQICEGIRSLNVEFKNQVLGPLTLSVGIATFPDHGENGNFVLQAADQALYQAKNEGRDRVVTAV